jgi:hypothetical protein
MASAALNYALNNGMTQEQYYKNIFDYVASNRGLNDVQLKAEMDRIGVSPEDVANATGVPLAGVQSRFNVATGTGAYVAPTGVAQSAGVTYGLNNNMTQAQIDKNIFDFVANNRGLNDVQLAAEMDRLGFSPNDVARATGVDYAGVLARYNAAKTGLVQTGVTGGTTNVTGGTTGVTNTTGTTGVTGGTTGVTGGTTGVTGGTAGGLLGTTGATSVTGTTPFANATQGFAQNFRNYQSIPIGAQYNPNVVGGTGSPYSQIMGQMRPVGNPYANVVAGQAMGGYNPALYDQILAANLERDIAAKSGVTLADYYGGGGDGASAGDSGGNTGGGPGTGAAGDAAFAQGGMVNNLLGPNPPGPDDGAGYLQNGEYVVKKSAVNKYGRGLLDMINEGKVPAKKIKSLLG